jgi:thioredoxin reductase (NADPH)
MEKIWDLVIIGAGPAGLAASIYASRYSIDHIVAGDILGAQISQTHHIDNYPGLEDMTGIEFAQKWASHAKKYGVEILPVLVGDIQKENDIFSLFFANGEVMKAKSIILSTGTKRKILNLPGEKELFGKGVSYCATCDGFFYKNKIAGVIGGADSAAAAAVYLADIAQKVYLIYRKKNLRAEPYWVNLIEKNPKIEVVYETNVTEIIGMDRLEKVRLDREYENSQELFLDGLFIEAGSVAGLTCAANLGIDLNESGYIKIKSNGATSVSGVFAAGDITDGSDRFCQVITAASEGAIAARAVFNYLKKNA